MEYNSAREEGRALREKLSQLYLQESELEKEHYCRALRLPNRTHPSVVRDHSPFIIIIIIKKVKCKRKYYVLLLKKKKKSNPKNSKNVKPVILTAIKLLNNVLLNVK